MLLFEMLLLQCREGFEAEIIKTLIILFSLSFQGNKKIELKEENIFF